MTNKIKEFSMDKDVMTPRWYLKPVMIVLAHILSGIFATNSKIVKHNFKSFKEPALIFSNHGSFVDFANMTRATYPYLPCYVTAIDEFAGKEWIMRRIGCFPKRKFTTDLTIIKKIVKLIQKTKISVCLYPEARWTLGGITEKIGDSLGKMAKLCKARIIVVNQKGNYLRSPVWNKHPYRKVKNYVDCYEIATKDEVLTLPAEELQKRIDKAMVYDDYKWQFDNKMKIKSKKRAENIHRILYKCCNCNEEGKMNSKGTSLWCENCNSKWEMDEYGALHCQNQKTKFPIVSNWYRWERDEVIKEVNEGTYHFEDDVRLERFINSKIQFKEIGKVHLTHNENGLQLKGTLDDGSEFDLHKPCLANSSMHIEFNYKNRGDALDVATLEATWFAFPLNKKNTILKFNFAAEALFDKMKTN